MVVRSYRVAERKNRQGTAGHRAYIDAREDTLGTGSQRGLDCPNRANRGDVYLGRRL